MTIFLLQVYQSFHSIMITIIGEYVARLTTYIKVRPSRSIEEEGIRCIKYSVRMK